MFKYRNVKTGAVIETPSELKGKNWEQIGGGKVEQTATAIPDAPVEEVEEVKPVKKTRKTTKKTTKWGQ